MNTNNNVDAKLKPCPLCGGRLSLYLRDETNSVYCNGTPCWDGGASCECCGVGFDVANFGGNVGTDTAEKHIVEILNRRLSIS